MPDQPTRQSRLAVIIAIVAVVVVAVVFILIRGDGKTEAPPGGTSFENEANGTAGQVTGDNSQPAETVDSASISAVEAGPITNPEFEVIDVGFTPGEGHIVTALEVVNHEDVPVVIQCLYAVRSKSGTAAFAGGWGSYTLQPGQNSFSDETFSNPTGGSDLTGADLVDDFDELSFSLVNECEPAWVLERFNADSSPHAIPVFNYSLRYLARDFGEVRYQPATPETCRYRLESSTVGRNTVAPEAWSDYDDAGPKGVSFDGVLDTHILARDCGQWQRNALECDEWDEVQRELDAIQLLEDGETVRKPANC